MPWEPKARGHHMVRNVRCLSFRRNEVSLVFIVCPISDDVGEDDLERALLVDYKSRLGRRPPWNRAGPGRTAVSDQARALASSILDTLKVRALSGQTGQEHRAHETHHDAFGFVQRHQWIVSNSQIPGMSDRPVAIRRMLQAVESRNEVLLFAHSVQNMRMTKTPGS